MTKFDGSVEIWRCAACKALLPMFDFFGETDVSNIGLLSGFRCGTRDLYIFEVSHPDRWVAFMTGREVGFNFQGVHIETAYVTRYIKAPPTDNRLPIAERIRTAKLDEPILKCPCCEKGEARFEESLTVEAFEEIGGRIIIADGLQMVPF